MSSAPRAAVLSVLAVLTAGLAVAGPGSAAQAAPVRPSSQVRTAEVAALTPTATTLAASASRVRAGQPVELTATVSSAGSTVDGGTVTFRAGATVLGSAPVVNGSAVLSVSTLAAGRYRLTAAYSGTGELSPSASGVDGTSPIRTIAGTGTPGFAGDGGAATSARLSYPSNLAVDGAGNVYVVDNGNDRIRKVATDGTITTVAGNGTSGFSGDGGPATSAQLRNPYSIAVDAAGTIFIGDDGNNRIRKVDAQGTITTYAGTGTSGFSGDGGPATQANLRVASMTIDAAGTVYFTDQGNGYVRKITPDGIITTIAGSGTTGYSGDGGPGTSARIRSPYGVGVDATGNVYFAEISNHVIRRVTPQGIISTYAGTGVAGSTGDGGQATLARLSTPGGMAVDASGNVFFNQFGTNQVRKVAPDGIISTVAGTGTAGYSGDGGPSGSAQLNDTEGLGIDAAGNLYLADSSNNVVRRVDGPVTLVVTTAPTADSYAAAEDTALTVAAPGVLGNDDDPDGTPLTATLVTGPDHGALVLNADGSFSYIPDDDFNGTDSFIYRASDGSFTSAPVTVTLTVSPVNDAPVSDPDAYTTGEGTALVVAAPGPLGNDTDVDGDALAAVLVDGPAHGTLTLSADGAFTYTPDAGYDGSDSFTYQASDGTLTSAVTTVSLLVTANGVPAADAGPDQDVAAGDTVTLDATGSTDPDGGTLTYSWAQAGGAPVALSDATSARPTFTAPASSTVLTFEVTVDDGQGGTDTDTVTVTVEADAPAVRRPRLVLSDDQRCLAPGASVGLRLAVDDGASLTVTSSNTALLPTSRIVLRRDGRALRLVMVPRELASGRARVTVAATNLAGTRRIAITVVVGTNEANRLVGTAGADVLLARSRADRLYGRAGRDLLCGRRGDDCSSAGLVVTRCTASAATTSSSAPARTDWSAAPVATGSSGADPSSPARDGSSSERDVGPVRTRAAPYEDGQVRPSRRLEGHHCVARGRDAPDLPVAVRRVTRETGARTPHERPGNE
jgi:VCBS repeat-containing protein